MKRQGPASEPSQESGVMTRSKRAKTVPSATSIDLSPLENMPPELFEKICDSVRNGDNTKLIALRMVSKTTKKKVDAYMQNPRMKPVLHCVKLDMGVERLVFGLPWRSIGSIGNEKKISKGGPENYAFLKVCIYRKSMPIHALDSFNWEETRRDGITKGEIQWRKKKNKRIALYERIHKKQKLEDVKLLPFLAGHTKAIEMNGWPDFAIDLLKGVTTTMLEIRNLPYLDDEIGEEIRKIVEKTSAKKATITTKDFDLSESNELRSDLEGMLVKKGLMMRRLMVQEMNSTSNTRHQRKWMDHHKE